VVAGALEHFNGQRYELLAYVIMNDHVHVLLAAGHGQSLERIVHSWKFYTGHVLQKARCIAGSIWQQEYHDRIIRDQDELRRQIQYVTTNPFKRWPEMSEYPWRRTFEY
jgi:REP element-mobilizing transposase RayT